MSSEEIEAERERQISVEHCWDCNKGLVGKNELGWNRCHSCFLAMHEEIEMFYENWGEMQ